MKTDQHLTRAAVCMLLSVTAVEAADFQYPLAVAATSEGVIYVADRNLPGIWKIEGDSVEKYFEGSKKFRTPLNAVRCLAIDNDGRLLAGDSATRGVYRFDEAAKPTLITEAPIGIGIPISIAVAADGTLFVGDLETQRIWKLPAEGGKAEEFARVTAPRGLTFDADGRLWVASPSSTKGSILRFDAEGNVETVLKERPFGFVHQIVVNTDGTCFVTDNYKSAVWKISPEGTAEVWLEGDPLNKPVGLCRNGEALLIADPHAKTVFSATADGTLTAIAGP